MLYKADTPRSRTQNICFLISISAVILKLMVKITSIFFSYRFLRIAWPDIFSHSDHFPTPNPRLLCFFFMSWPLGCGLCLMSTWLIQVCCGSLQVVSDFSNYVCSVFITPQGSKLRYICYKISHLVALVLSKISGTQRLFSAKYLFGEANIAQNFLQLEDG